MLERHGLTRPMFNVCKKGGNGANANVVMIPVYFAHGYHSCLLKRAREQARLRSAHRNIEYRRAYKVPFPNNI